MTDSKVRTFGIINPRGPSLAALELAIRETQRIWPLPRCIHDNCLKDGGGELLEPPCGCRYPMTSQHGVSK